MIKVGVGLRRFQSGLRGRGHGGRRQSGDGGGRGRHVVAAVHRGRKRSDGRGQRVERSDAGSRCAVVVLRCCGSGRRRIRTDGVVAQIRVTDGRRGSGQAWRRVFSLEMALVMSGVAIDDAWRASGTEIQGRVALVTEEIVVVDRRLVLVGRGGGEVSGVGGGKIGELTNAAATAATTGIVAGIVGLLTAVSKVLGENVRVMGGHDGG